jgi:peroxiredoxin
LREVGENERALARSWGKMNERGGSFPAHNAFLTDPATPKKNPMKMKSTLVLGFFAALLFLNSVFAAPKLADKAEAVQPVLVGSAVPDVQLADSKASKVKLTSLLDRVAAGKPAVMVFYRGGWCPYCNLHLKELRKIVAPMQAKGVPLIAISPDQPSELFKTIQKSELDYTLLSDSKAELIQALGIGFTVDQATRKKYAEYGIDLSKASGEKHFILPAPAVFVVSADRKIAFSYVNPDYSTRLSGNVVLAMVDAALEMKAKK